MNKTICCTVFFLFQVYMASFGYAEDIVQNTELTDEASEYSEKFKGPTSGFRQLSNKELWENRLFNVSQDGIARSPQELEGIKQRYLTSKQNFYDEFLKMLIWHRHIEHARWKELDMEDLKKLSWVIETNKKIYKVGEPVGVRLFIKNISSEESTVLNTALQTGFMLNSIKLERVGMQERRLLYLTESGNRRYPFATYVGFRGTYNVTKLQPGDRTLTNHSIKILNLFYDLSEPGEYELTFYTRNYLGDDEHQVGEYPKPCTIRFTIENKFYEPEIEWPDDVKTAEKVK